MEVKPKKIRYFISDHDTVLGINRSHVSQASFVYGYHRIDRRRTEMDKITDEYMECLIYFLVKRKEK